MDVKTINEQAQKKRKENVKAVISDRRSNQQYGIRNNTDGTFGIRKSAIINDNPVNIKDTVGNIKSDIKDYVKDAKEIAVSDVKAVADYEKSGGNQAYAKLKKTVREVAPPKVHMKNVIKKARIKEMLQSSDMQQFTKNMEMAGINAITSSLQYMARSLMKGCLLIMKKILVFMGPIIGGFFLFAMLLIICIQSANTDPLSINVPETGKIDGVRVDMQGIETNPWYTTKNPFHQSGYGMVPRKSSGKGNCTCYAWGRRAEITGEAPNFSTGNASAWYDYNIKNKIYKYGNVPKAGAVCCWKGGSDGSGHVAVVEVVNDDGSFTISESSWTRFFFRTRAGMKADSMNEGNLIFQGFIYMDAYDE